MTVMSPSSVQTPIHHHTHEEQQHQHEFQFGNVGPINLTDNEIYQHIQLQLAGLTPSDPTQNVYQHETPPFASTSTQTSETAPSDSSTQTPEAPSELNPNPYPFPPYYPESAHFVRQWWPTLPGVRRMSCTVVLLAAHNPINHRTRFVLAQHYFGVPVTGQSVEGEQEGSTGESGVHEHREANEEDDMLKLWYVSTPFEVVCVLDRTEENGTSEGKNDETAAPAHDGLAQNGIQTAGDDINADGGDDDDESDIHGVNERPRPLVAVDFGHAVWVEHCGERHACGQREFCGAKVGEETGYEDSEEGELDIQARISNVVEKRNGKPNGKGKERVGAKKGKGKKKQTKCLRFVTFPAVGSSKESSYCAKRDRGSSSTTPLASTHRSGGQDSASTGVVRTLDIPDELDLDSVETINIDQSQGAVILSVREGKIFILMYE
ncbi:hypothetical protein SERLADRAFT_463222 [Serpula lacrymans var. lacrymans S7.9]|uniref:Uncharacterized protein n=1 Tax=Serpula lacrymans var. lacrymans (strain S7.9) TaxID=578457 RepID=F8NRP6_SERL9|nr:uncharacterized protein SERLADRAFT_463222 [Serpula lacrymans var. lacrymans S7.9]EGO26312.1 hypothetical protein SERLADRAFT_463222 [Serpula lacrymans var. lacrymans S7.9]